MTYPLCGDCLHARSCHTQIEMSLTSDIFNCGACGKFCEPVQYNTDHKPSGAIVQDGVFIQIKVDKKQ